METTQKRRAAEELFDPYWVYPQWRSLSVGEGWLDLVMETMDALRKVNPDVKVLQVKSKFGLLRFYIAVTTPEMREIIADAENKSCTMCEACGGVGQLGQSARGWWSVYCADDAPEGWTMFEEDDDE